MSSHIQNKAIEREPKPGAKEIIEKWRELKAIHGDINYEAHTRRCVKALSA